ncbi:hypothetical protein E3E12_07995 [Formicincola oecophyllae]|uniref:Uncharacterized protein n=1 Tax=Formicincola oecophyllae TaxID=2558361 RepID=A0A4Y6UCG3_9PROT|nr:hypothetical protein [Formicincola oecophyllae]QDH14137.1 hypothetical protein E3E12_07995 [Formicincola oecophyllae]
MTTSLTLNERGWDLTLDGAGNLATLSGHAATLQDVASALQTWIGECFYDLSQGLPYDSGLLGPTDSPSLFAAQAEAAALQVPGVAAVRCVPQALGPGRQLSGVVGVTFTDGGTAHVNF